MSAKWKNVVVQSINLQGLANGIMDEIIEPALLKVVKDSSNTIDDALMPMLWPLLEKEVKEMIAEKLDLSKMLGMDEAAASE